MLRYFKYQLPFNTPFKISSQTLYHREGIILVFEHDNITAFGEIAPLPGFSEFDLNQILPILAINRKPFEHALIQSDGDQFLHILNQIHRIPSLMFGLNTLLLDFKAKQNHEPLGKFLKGSQSNSVLCNAVLGISSIERTIEDAEKIESLGFDTIKLKVGSNLSHEIEILRHLRHSFPNIKIRLDANQAWSTRDAILALNKFSKYDIEYCEQPIKKESILGLAEVRNNTSVKIAADESCRNKADAQLLLDNDAVDILILKPMMFGGFLDISVTKKLADSHGIDTVFTTSFENKIGRTTTAILASIWGSNVYAHGLSTGSLYKTEPCIPTEIHNGHYILNNKPGIGTHIDYSNFEEII